MLDRSNAFAVYYNLNCALDRDAERKRRDEVLTAADEKQEDSEEAVKTDIDKEETKEQAKPKEVSKEDPRSKYKALVNYVNAFTAFAHFDQNIVGHLVDHDLEQIIHSIGLNISRGDIQRLTKKFSAYEHVNYRNYTDKWVDKDGNHKYIPTPRQDAPTMAELLTGHSDEKFTTHKEPASALTPDVTESGTVFYKGTVLNIHHALEQQRKIEAERETALMKVEELEGVLKTTREDRDRLEKKKKILTGDVEHYKKKLYDTEKCLKKSDDDTVKIKTTLQDCKKIGEKLLLMVDKVMPSKKKEEPKEKDKNLVNADEPAIEETKQSVQECVDQDLPIAETKAETEEARL